MTAAALARAAKLVGVAALGWVAIAAELAPVQGAPGTWPAPDLLFSVAAAFAARRAAAPAWLVFLLGVLRDALGAGPLGLGALALLAGSEGVRRAALAGRPRGFLGEWVGVSVWAAAALALTTLGLGLTLAPTPTLGELGLRLAATVAAYPLIALGLRAALGARTPMAAEGDLMFGRRA